MTARIALSLGLVACFLLGAYAIDSPWKGVGFLLVLLVAAGTILGAVESHEARRRSKI